MTLGEEIDHVERYLRLEQARFRDGLHVTVDVPAETRGAVVPAMSVQPLVENAVRHGVERRAGRAAWRSRPGSVAATSSCGYPTTASGSSPSASRRCWPAPAGASACPTSTPGCGRRSASATRCAIESDVGEGTTAVMTVPNLRGEIPQPELAGSA